MAEYLIQGTTLDAIADAINAKTGGSSAMTPAEMAAAIAAIPSGGGAGVASGSVTLSTSGALIIPHNLNSLRVACFVCPTGTITAGYGYTPLSLVVANFTEFFQTELETVLYDFSSYNGTNYPEPVERTGAYPIGSALKSPWTSHNYGTWNSASGWAVNPVWSTGGDVPIVFNSNDVRVSNFAAGTYVWKAVAL